MSTKFLFFATLSVEPNFSFATFSAELNFVHQMSTKYSKGNFSKFLLISQSDFLKLKFILLEATIYGRFQSCILKISQIFLNLLNPILADTLSANFYVPRFSLLNIREKSKS